MGPPRVKPNWCWVKSGVVLIPACDALAEGLTDLVCGLNMGQTAEVLGREVPMHRYAVQITVADARDGACSSSTLKEAASWGKVDTTYEQMVFAEATTVVPLIASHLYHQKGWRKRKRREWSKLFG